MEEEQQNNVVPNTWLVIDAIRKNKGRSIDYILKQAFKTRNKANGRTKPTSDRTNPKQEGRNYG